MDNKELKNLVDVFSAYRETLEPIQTNLKDFADTYGKLKDDIEKLNQAFGNEAAAKMEQIYKSLSAQAASAVQLVEKIDKFTNVSDEYARHMSKMLEVMSRISDKLQKIEDLENSAEKQIALLDGLLADKKKNYDLTTLQKSLSNYDNNVQKISEFINKDVAEALRNNNKKLDEIAQANERLSNQLQDEHKSITALTEKYVASGAFLEKIAEKEDVNEIYLFEVLDKWADKRKVKYKKGN